MGEFPSESKSGESSIATQKRHPSKLSVLSFLHKFM